MGNPFRYGSAVRGPAFGDRERELRSLTGFMRNGINVLLLSPRRYGKSSLTLRAVERIQRERGRAARADLARCGPSLQEFAETLASAVFRDALGGARGLTHEVQRRLAELRASVRMETGLTADGRPSFSVALTPLRPDTDWRAEIEAVLRALVEGAGDRTTALVIDEFQRVEAIDPTLPWFFKGISDQLPQLSLVFAGSRRTFMSSLAQGANAPFTGLGETMSLDVIPEPVMVAFLRDRTTDEAKEMEEGAAHRIYALAAGVPAYVQQLAYHAFEEAGRAITPASVDRGLLRLLENEGAVFADRLDRRPGVQQRVLKALAAAPERQPFSMAFMARAGIGQPGSVRKALSPLEEDELIDRNAGEWRVSNPFFGLWLRTPG